MNKKKALENNGKIIEDIMNKLKSSKYLDVTNITKENELPHLVNEHILQQYYNNPKVV